MHRGKISFSTRDLNDFHKSKFQMNNIGKRFPIAYAYQDFPFHIYITEHISYSYN